MATTKMITSGTTGNIYPLEVNYRYSLKCSFFQPTYPQCCRAFLVLWRIWSPSFIHTPVCEWCFEVKRTDAWHIVWKICSNQDVIWLLEFGSLSPKSNVFSFVGGIFWLLLFCCGCGLFCFFLQNYYLVFKKNIFCVDLVKGLCSVS